MSLGNRLDTIVELVEACDLIADIGTDHAYIPIELIRQKKVKHAIATDIIEGPIKNALENVKLHGMEGQIDVFLSNGLEGYEGRYSKIDYYIIAGMGGDTIISILEGFQNPHAVLLLQPMTARGTLRAWLYENGFVIEEERIAIENRKYYHILKVTYCPNSKDTLEKFERNFGKNLRRDENYKKYLQFELKTQQTILEQLSHSKNPDENRISRLQQNIEMLKRRIFLLIESMKCGEDGKSFY